MVARIRQRMFQWRALEALTARRDEDRNESRAQTKPIDRATPADWTNRRPNPNALTREQMLNRILELNHGVDPEFLDEFENHRLAAYLERLENLTTPRGPEARWIRPGESPAIMVRTRRD